MFVGWEKSCLPYIQEIAKLSKNYQAFRIRKKGYHNIY